MDDWADDWADEWADAWADEWADDWADAIRPNRGMIGRMIGRMQYAQTGGCNTPKQAEKKKIWNVFDRELTSRDEIQSRY